MTGDAGRAARSGVRLLAFNRPGYGSSTPTGVHAHLGRPRRRRAARPVGHRAGGGARDVGRADRTPPRSPRRTPTAPPRSAWSPRPADGRDRAEGTRRGRDGAAAPGVHGVARPDRPRRRGRRGARRAVPGRAARGRRRAAAAVRRRVRRQPGLGGAGQAGGLPPRRRAAVPASGTSTRRRCVPDHVWCRRARREGARRSRWWAERLPHADVEVLPGTTHLAAAAHPVAGDPRGASEQRRVDDRRRPAHLGRLLVRRAERQQQPLAARRADEASCPTGQRFSRRYPAGTTRLG